MGYIGKSPEHGRYGQLDQINGTFNGSNVTFNLTVDSEAVYPTNPQTLIISLNGVIQQPGTDFTVSAATITFTTAPASGVGFFGVLLGDTLDIGTPSDGSVTVAKMAANSVDSAQYVDGSIDRVHLAADIIDGTKIDDDVINSEHYVAASIDNEHLADDAVDSDEIADGAVDRVHLAADIIDGTKIDDDVINSEHYVAGSIDLEHMASQSVDEDNLYISNAGSNGEFLSKQSGNNGGLTWAAAGGGGLVFIDTAIASTSSTLEVTLTGSYETYLISGSDLDFSNDVVQINGRMGTSGAWADEYKNAYHRVRSDNVHDHAYSNSQAYMQLSSTIGNATGEGATFTVWFNKPIGIADTYPMIHGTMMAINHNHQVEAGEIHSMGISALDVARFKIYPSTGTFTSGRLTVWGLVHA